MRGMVVGKGREKGAREGGERVVGGRWGRRWSGGVVRGREALAHRGAGEDLVRVGVLLEERLGARVRVLVRVPLARQLAVRALDRKAARVLPKGGGLVRGGARRRASREGG